MGRRGLRPRGGFLVILVIFVFLVIHDFTRAAVASARRPYLT